MGVNWIEVIGEIKKFSIGIITYIFEVKAYIYAEPPEEFGLTKMVQECYVAEPGSIACYTENQIMQVCKKDLWFPKDGCKNPLDYELADYELLDLVWLGTSIII